MRTFRWKQRPFLTLSLTAVLTWSVASWVHSNKDIDPVVVVRDVVAPSNQHIRVNVTIPAEVYNIKDKIKELARNIFKAKKHVRGTKTGDSLNEAVIVLKRILDDLDIDPGPLKERPTYNSKNVCPEEYKGTTYGYPFFYEGFQTKNCSHGKPVETLVSIVSYMKLGTTTATDVRRIVERFVNSLSTVGRNITLILGLDQEIDYIEDLLKLHSRLLIKSALGHVTAGAAWNTLLDLVTTPYTLIARNVEIFTNDSRLLRLVREIESLDVTVAAGSHRTPDGHWKNGCFQSAYRNYTLVYLEGYDESLHECLFCDHIDSSPFVVKSKSIKDLKFRELEESNGLFEDVFLRLKEKHLGAAVCPDSMFHVKPKAKVDLRWGKFSKDWSLQTIKTPNGLTIENDCSAVFDASGSRGLAPCKLKDNANVVRFIMDACASANIICELQEGTALGALKFEKVLPWERDGDVTFFSGNYTAFENLSKKFADARYHFKALGSLWCCADNRTAGGKFAIATRGWNIELYGQHMMDSELLRGEGIKPTQVLLDGKWVNVPRNPGLFVRNRYGHEIYRHALHWMTTGASSGWSTYKTNTFLRCDTKGHHACLDRYNADGNMQFTNPLP